jgi:hypothetical protein
LGNKFEKCILVGYKYGIKGYKLWNLLIKKNVYSRDVLFREVKIVPKYEFKPREELETIEFDLESEKPNSIEEDELEEEEPQSPISRN